jgi:hypothetical protein
MSEPPIYYFAYGSNLNLSEMHVRCPGAKPLTPATLAGWRLTFRGGGDIEPAHDAVVPGALWRLSHVDRRSLDRYEGAPHLYERRLLEVDTESVPLEAIAYVMTSDDYLGLPSPWYFERIVEGYADWGLPRGVLSVALGSTREELAERGVSDFRPDGRKRLRGLID